MSFRALIIVGRRWQSSFACSAAYNGTRLDRPPRCCRGATTMIEPGRAPVRPRVRSLQSGETLLLEEEVHSFVATKAKGLIALRGPGGCGKTTALQHLAAVLNAG